MNLAEPQPGESIFARFTPGTTDDLTPQAIKAIGRVLRWYAAWEITEDEDRRLAGQWAWMPVPYATVGGLVPTMDLTEEVSIAH